MNRDIAALLGYEAGQWEVEQRGRAGAEEAWREGWKRSGASASMYAVDAFRLGFESGRAAAQAEGKLREQVAVIEDRREQAAKHHEIIERWEKAAEGFRERATIAEEEAARLRDAVKTISREWDQTAGLQHQSPRLWEAFDRLVAIASDPARGKDDPS